MIEINETSFYQLMLTMLTSSTMPTLSTTIINYELCAELSSDNTKSESVNDFNDSGIIVRTIVSGASFPSWESLKKVLIAMDEKMVLDQLKGGEIWIMKLEMLLVGASNVNFQEIPKQNVLLITFRADKPLQKKLNAPGNIMLVLGKWKARFILISLYFQYDIHIVYIFIDRAIKFGTIMPKVTASGITVPNELHFNFLNVKILIISTVLTKISDNVAGERSGGNSHSERTGCSVKLPI